LQWRWGRDECLWRRVGGVGEGGWWSGEGGSGTPARRDLKGIYPRGNNKVVIIIFYVYDKCLFLMLELY
jgi:hypothetical protein